MKDLFELARLERQLEEMKKEMYGTTNLNTMGAISEDAFARFMTERTGLDHIQLGGNTKGFDVECPDNGLRYEVKSTQTSVKSYNYGNLADKDADFAVFVKWAYEGDLVPEYLLIYPMEVVHEHLNEGYQRFTSTALKKTIHLAEDLSQDFIRFMNNNR